MANLYEFVNDLSAIIVNYEGRKTKKSPEGILEQIKEVRGLDRLDKFHYLHDIIKNIEEREKDKGYVRAPLYKYILNTIELLQNFLDKDYSSFDEAEYYNITQEINQFFTNIELLLATHQSSQVAIKFQKSGEVLGNTKNDNLYGLKNNFLPGFVSLCISGTILTEFLATIDPIIKQEFAILIKDHINTKKDIYTKGIIESQNQKISELAEENKKLATANQNLQKNLAKIEDETKGSKHGILDMDNIKKMIPHKKVVESQPIAQPAKQIPTINKPPQKTITRVNSRPNVGFFSSFLGPLKDTIKEAIFEDDAESPTAGKDPQKKGEIKHM